MDTSRHAARYRRLSLRGPVTLFVVVLVLCVTLTVLWNVALVQEYQKLRELTHDVTFRWGFMALGSVLFLTIIILSSVLGAQLISHIRWLQRQSNFMASVSHELNSPLSSIKLFAQTLRRPEMSDEDRLNFVGKILADVERLQRLISNILRATEVDNFGAEIPVTLQATELENYLEDYIEDVKSRHWKAEIQFESDCASSVRLDGMMFRQVLDNLVDNAVRYRGERPARILIRHNQRGGWAKVQVIDQGMGIDPADLPKLFDRFFQVEDPTRPRGRRGTGIGLYVVRSIIISHEGWVEARSAGIDRGTTIHIRLPIFDPALEEGAEDQDSAPEGALPLESHPAG